MNPYESKIAHCLGVHKVTCDSTGQCVTYAPAPFYGSGERRTIDIPQGKCGVTHDHPMPSRGVGMPRAYPGVPWDYILLGLAILVVAILRGQYNTR